MRHNRVLTIGEPVPSARALPIQFGTEAKLTSGARKSFRLVFFRLQRLPLFLLDGVRMVTGVPWGGEGSGDGSPATAREVALTWAELGGRRGIEGKFSWFKLDAWGCPRGLPLASWRLR